MDFSRISVGGDPKAAKSLL
jgi:hypothetical protein